MDRRFDRHIWSRRAITSVGDQQDAGFDVECQRLAVLDHCIELLVGDVAVTGAAIDTKEDRMPRQGWRRIGRVERHIERAKLLAEALDAGRAPIPVIAGGLSFTLGQGQGADSKGGDEKTREGCD
ncbi:MAG TPA: hypothetical protein ENK31_03015, partial [Nannocystis exedens]|nr:hypothetical protein [Nannocystis exedens]